VLVTHVLGDCPGCGGKNQFGNVMVCRNHVLRGCMACDYHIKIPLPDIRKKILYLDQFFLSGAFRGSDKRFAEAAQRVRKMTHLQLLVAPFSSVHADETHQWRGYNGKAKDDLMEFIKAISGGHRFRPAYEVERFQIVRAFRAFLAGQPSEFHCAERDAISDDVHKWENYFRLDVSGYYVDVELLRTLKQKSVGMLVDAFDEWRTSTNSFQEDIAVELWHAAKAYTDSFAAHVSRIAAGDLAAVFNGTIMSMVVESLLDCLSDEASAEERFRTIGRFFASEHFWQAPYQWISARVCATLKDMVKRGAYPNREKALQRLSGFFSDVRHAASYAPYCNAFVMDRAMAELVSDPRVGIEARYGVKVFSLSNWDEFLSWLDALEAAMTEEHKAGLVAAYPYLDSTGLSPP